MSRIKGVNKTVLLNKNQVYLYEIMNESAKRIEIKIRELYIQNLKNLYLKAFNNNDSNFSSCSKTM
jgi:hypothetical protein